MKYLSKSSSVDFRPQQPPPPPLRPLNTRGIQNRHPLTLTSPLAVFSSFFVLTSPRQIFQHFTVVFYIYIFMLGLTKHYLRYS